MRAIVTGTEMKAYDRATIEKTGIPSLLLMERAALETVRLIKEKYGEKKRMAVFAGLGNNGGDALAVGRILAMEDYVVDFWMPTERAKISNETKKQVEILQNLGFSIHDNLPDKEYDIVIDGLFGVGLTRPLTGIYEKAVERMNALKDAGAFVVAVDIPSGICADTGKIMGCAVRADVTVTFAYAKAGHYFYPGKEYTKELRICPIGIFKEAAGDVPPSYETFTKEEIKEQLPIRNAAGNKGTFGKVLLFAGSVNMCGAAILCAGSILRSGAGMVKVITCEENREILQKALPEAMLFVYKEETEAETVFREMEWADVLAAGPGIGRGKDSTDLLSLFLKQGEKPLVLDADALNLIAMSEELQNAVKSYKGEVVMTPHPGEFVRLAGIDMEKYRENPTRAVKELAEKFNCVLVGKDAVTLVTSPGDNTVYLNVTGNDGMATAGSGDVLTGIIGGLLAQGLHAKKAASLGVYLHGNAGDKAASVKSNYGVIASDIIEYLWQE